ncbi:hypothetical protein EON80_26495 [bacterium]|nr:MAG: hypothetical protein EON80_26495 [bacterium]
MKITSLTSLAISWVLAVAVGFGVLLNHQNTPGAAANSAGSWPMDTGVVRDSSEATIIVAAHPKCPCTRATIGELARLMARCQGKVSAKVLFLKPKGVTDNWEKTDLWRSAAAIPGVIPVTDAQGLEARRFGAKTSGQTFLFDKNGRLLFSGGITASRGHSGDNTGIDSIEALLTTGKSAQHSTPVFGCSLVDPSTETAVNPASL